MLPKINKNIFSSWHLYIVSINFSKIKKNKKQLINLFLKNKIRVQQHYIPINKFSYYKKKIQGKFPNSELYYKNSLSLPIHVSCSKKDIKKVCNQLLKFVKK